MNQISRSSWVMKLAYLYDYNKPYLGDRVSLCRVFWKSVASILFSGMIAFIVGSLIFLACNALYLIWLRGLILRSILIVGAVGVWAFLLIWGGSKQDKIDRKIKNSYLGRVIKAYKDKHCPIYEVKE